MSDNLFEINHNWGDPREPSYKNDSKISYAYYKEGDIHLHFKIYEIQSDGVRSVVLETPDNIRLLLNNDWSKCESVIQRVSTYLKGLDKSTVHRDYSHLIVDASKVPKWFPTQIKLLEEKYPFFMDTIPDAKTFPLILLGLIIVLSASRLKLIGLSENAVGMMLMAIGLTTLGMLISDIATRWLSFYRFPSTLKTLYKWNTQFMLQATFKRYHRRYLVTFCFSLLILTEGLRVNA